MTVTMLGAWDESGDGFLGPHDIGLWDAGGTLLASTTVTSASAGTISASGLGVWRFEAIASVALAPGIYTLGAFTGLGPGIGDPGRILQPTASAPGTALSPFGVFDFGGALARPTSPSGPAGIYGPNLVFGTPAAVPEASSVLLWLAGGAPVGLVAVRKRRARR
jgi:hypothetical protein